METEILIAPATEGLVGLASSLFRRSRVTILCYIMFIYRVTISFAMLSFGLSSWRRGSCQRFLDLGICFIGY